MTFSNGNVSMRIDGELAHRARPVGRRSPTSSRRPDAVRWPGRNGQPAHERTRRHRRHRHRGSHRSGHRPQRAVAVRPPAGARRRARADRDRRRPPADMHAGAGLAGRRGRRPDRHQRRPGADRGRPDGAGRRASSRAARWCSTSALEERIADDPAAADGALAEPRHGRRPGRQPQAGRDPDRRHGARPGRDRAGARRPAVGRFGGPTVVVLPGPPRELQPLWREASKTDAFAAAVAGATTYEQTMLRIFGLPESEIADTMREARESGIDIDRLEITTCLRRGELEIVTRYEPDPAAIYEAFERAGPRAPRGAAVLRRRLDDRPAGGGDAARRWGGGSGSRSRAPAGCWRGG